jgi:hypothetical protein
MKTGDLKRLVVSQVSLFLFGGSLILFLRLNYTGVNQELPGSLLGFSSFGRSLPDNLDLLLNGDLAHIDRYKVFKSMIAYTLKFTSLGFSVSRQLSTVRDKTTNS